MKRPTVTRSVSTAGTPGDRATSFRATAPATTSRPAPPPPREAAGRRLPTVSGDVAVLAALAAFTATIAALTWGTWGDLSMDTGYDLVAGARVHDGEYPYIDFYYWYGPLGALLLGQAFDLFGTTIGAAVGLGVGLAAAIVAGSYALGRTVTTPLGAGLAAALVATAAFSSGNNSFVLPHTTTVTLAVALSLCALLAASKVARGGGRRWFVATGLAVGGVALARPEYTVAIVAALALWLGLRTLASGDRRRALVDALIVAVPAVALPALVYGIVLTRVPLSALVTENLYPVDYLDAAGNKVLKAAAPLTPASFVELAGRLALYAAGCAALVATGVSIGRGGSPRKAAIALCAGVVLVFLAVLAARPDTVRYYLEFAYSWLPAGAWVALGVLAVRYRRRAGAWTARAQMELLAIAFIAVLATKSYASFLPHPNPTHPPDTPYMLPFAAAFLAWLHLGELARGRPGVRAVGAGWLAILVLASAVLVVGDARKETVTVNGPNGQLTALPKDGPAYQGAVDFIERETRAGEPVLLAPQMTSLYTLSGRPDPLPQISLLPGSLATVADEEEAIRTLDAKGVRLAITDRETLDGYGHGAFGQTFDRRLARWLRSAFQRTAVLRGSGSAPRVLDVWQRRTP